MKIGIGCDHVAYDFKLELIEWLAGKGVECEDFGAPSSERTDYPIYAEKVSRAVASGRLERGILICGTGVGMSIAANKIKGIRAVVCSEPYSAMLSKQHNNTNILCFGARVIGIELAKMIVEQWLAAEYEGGRHATRVGLISKLEEAEGRA